MALCPDLDAFNSLGNEDFESGKLLYSFSTQHSTYRMVDTQRFVD